MTSVLKVTKILALLIKICVKICRSTVHDCTSQKPLGSEVSEVAAVGVVSSYFKLCWFRSVYRPAQKVTPK